MAELTCETLINLITPKVADDVSNRISTRIYAIRKEQLDKKLSHIMDILRYSYWKLVTDFIATLPIKSNPVLILVKLREASFNTQTRDLDIVYSYFIDIYVITKWLQILEKSVENTIEYEEIIYDDFY